MDTNIPVEKLIDIKVELFGQARIIAGCQEIDISVPVNTIVSDIAGILGKKYPSLIGKVLENNGSKLLDSYTLNINGKTFVSDGSVGIEPNDIILIFSSQAGG